MPGIPDDLRPPFRVMLAQPAKTIPGPKALPGGCLYEPKWDGYRLVIVRHQTGVGLWSRQGRDLTARFPDIAAAARAHISPATILDGEVVVWRDDRLDFSALQSRFAAGPARIARVARETPASYVAFDVLAISGMDLRKAPLVDRRAALEKLAAGWRPPLNVTPQTADRTVAQGWFTAYRVAGMEGLVVKGASSRYRCGGRDWIKVKAQDDLNVVVGAVTGTLRSPTALVVGVRADGKLRIAGRSLPLSAKQAAELGPVLEEAGPAHPWPPEVRASRFTWSATGTVQLQRIVPIVVDIRADVAFADGSFRHPVRYLRHRPDLHPEDVEPLP